MKRIFTILTTSLCLNLFFGQACSEHRIGGLNHGKRPVAKSVLDVNVNPNTLNYDLQYVRLELDLDPNKLYVSGTVTSHFNMLADSRDIYFDIANNLTVSDVKYHGESLTFEKLDTHEVRINFPTELSAQTIDSLSISYSGVPDQKTDAFSVSKTSSGDPILATLSEPFGSREWWPTKQSMNDKIEKLDIKITTPDKYTVGSNGKLISETNLGNGKKLTYWQTNYPIPAYLFALGISNYTKLNSTITTKKSSFPFLNYLYPSSVTENIKANIDWTQANMQLFEDHFGLYPYRDEKYGHMQFSWGGAMEHSTMSSMGTFSKSIIAHELAHQWFGDKLTCGSWNDIWLNEGFASFGEQLVNEKLLMSPNQFKSDLDFLINYITSQPGGSVYIYDKEPTFYRIFDSRLSYSKAGFVVRMLKWILGDEKFYETITAYQNYPAFEYNYVKTNDFKDFLNTYTGKDFTNFFDDWIYGEGYPSYQIKWNQNSGSKQLTFNVGQTRSSSKVSFFEMPLPIKVTGANGEEAYFVLDHNSDNQLFTEDVNFDVTSVFFNYERQILTNGSTVVRDNNLSTNDTKRDKISIFPNPTKTYLKINGVKEISNYEIISVDGKLIEKGTTNANSEINTSSLIKGVYILKLNNQSFKFIKE